MESDRVQNLYDASLSVVTEDANPSPDNITQDQDPMSFEHRQPIEWSDASELEDEVHIISTLPSSPRKRDKNNSTTGRATQQHQRSHDPAKQLKSTMLDSTEQC